MTAKPTEEQLVVLDEANNKARSFSMDRAKGFKNLCGTRRDYHQEDFVDEFLSECFK